MYVLRAPVTSDRSSPPSYVAAGVGRLGDMSVPFRFNPARAALPPRPYQAELVRDLVRTVTPSAKGRFYIHVATGGGKTLVTNDWLGRHVLPTQRVLWLTKDWELLGQAARDLIARHAGADRLAGYFGNAGDALRGIRSDVNARIVYSTLQTWYSRRAQIAKLHFDKVVIDELHWGEGTGASAWVCDNYRGRAAVVGLTATPRKYSTFQRVGRACDFPMLVREGYLARPVVHEVESVGATLAAERSGSHGDFTATSLRTLGGDRARNDLIVETYCAQRDEFDQTIVFACDIEHAEELSRKFQRRGIPAEAIHSQLPKDVPTLVLQRFRVGRTRVLVNVAKLTHGVDIPEIKSVFLARPTLSPTLFSQMVGRGSRTTSTKSSFNVVAFEDNLERHGDLLVRPRRFFGEVGEVRVVKSAASRVRLARHAYEPAPIEVIPADTDYPVLAGLEIAPRQTFGIEFEITRADVRPGSLPRDFFPIAEQLRRAIPRALVASRVLHATDLVDDSLWNVKPDASCGWEITTRVLQGEEGFCEVVAVLDAIAKQAERLGLRVDARTGAHIHLGWGTDVSNLRRLFETVAWWEPALSSLLPPSRAENPYCKRVRRHLHDLRKLNTIRDWERHFASRDARYLAVNPAPLLQGRGTIEVRSHSGTLEAGKILTWISLWMRVLHAASERSPGVLGSFDPNAVLDEGPKGDLAEFANYFALGRPLYDRLSARQGELVTASSTRDGSRRSFRAVSSIV